MSTSAEMLRCPARSRRCLIHAGVGARGFTSRITRPEHRPHRSAAAIFTGKRSSSSTGAGSNIGSRSGTPAIADNSRATPWMLMQCARFGVSFSAWTASSSSSAPRRSAPGGASTSSDIRPLWSSDRPSSRAEHSIPSLSTPRIVTGLISRPPGSCAPGSAHGTHMSGFTFGAPQTIVRSRPSPASTSQTDSLAAFGWRATLRTRATTTPWNGGAAALVSSTSRPAMVSRSAISSLVQSGDAKLLSQFSGTRILGSGLSVELLQEAQVVLVEHPQVAHAVAQHRQPLDARAECETDVAFGIEAEVAHHVGVDLARPADLEPAPCQRTVGEAHVDLRRRLGERKVRRPEAHVEVVALEEAAQ